MAYGRYSCYGRDFGIGVCSRVCVPSEVLDGTQWKALSRLPHFTGISHDRVLPRVYHSVHSAGGVLCTLALHARLQQCKK